MELEIVLAPVDEEVGAKLGDAPGWPAFAEELRGVLDVAITASGVGSLQIDGLGLDGPLPEDQAWLRNGAGVPADRAAELFVEMMRRPSGPSFRLVGADVLRIEESWDGWVFLPATQAVWDAVEDLPEVHLKIGWRDGQPDIMKVEVPVETVADEEFWSTVRAAAGTSTTLLGERWAFGNGGIRWFLLSPENVDEVIASVEPGSFVCVAVDPDLRLRLTDQGGTAFAGPLEPGALVHRDVWHVEDDAALAQVTGAGFDLLLSDAAQAELYAVVPGPDGALRRWEDPK